MYLLGGTLALAALTAAQSSIFASSPASSSVPSSSSSEPCAEARRMYDASPAGIVEAKTAYECLTSVPVAVEEDKRLIDQLKAVWAMHSETGYLKNTPDSWELGPVDLLGELDKIKQNLSSYDSDYDVHLAIQDLTLRTGNFHFNYVPDILQIFFFQRTVQLATVSEDGQSVPKTYVVQDLEDDSTSKISAITKIDGQDVQEYLEKLAFREQYIDSDAGYNSLMYRGPGDSGGSFASPRDFGVYSGPSTTLTFANGTSRSYDNYAEAYKPLEGVTSGKSLYQRLCTGQYTSDTAALEELMATKGPHRWARRSIPSSGYPEPVVAQGDGAVAGYFMTDSDLGDIAVLKIISFDADGKNATEFQSVVRGFLQKCEDSGMDKLIVDLRENGGGATDLLLDTFMQLFPDYVPFSAQRYRATEPFKLIGDTVNEIYSSEDAQDTIRTQTGYDLEELIDVRFWSYWDFVDVNGDTFESWDQYYGPHKYNEDEFTTTMRYNMSNRNRESVLSGNYRFVTTSGEPVIAAENILMLTDGMCGSSCASFHEEMKNIAGVKAVTVGGRAQDGPMQTVAGTKGGEVIGLNFLVSPLMGPLSSLMNISDALDIGDLDHPSVQQLVDPQDLLTRAGNGDSRIQIQDQIRKGDESGAPLQYIYEAADCRLFYTSETLFDSEKMWAAAWGAYKDDSKCVKGSTNQASSISGGYKPFGPGDLNGKMQQGDSSKKESDATNLQNPGLIFTFAAAAALAVLI
ncbi:hypothetical protein FE257_007473 [Aspergillus nanangensis]|uniref:Tail specific protease domain-containing protein n=1 Tax=Aspergillus nanangensis TaxID=2582783 RepID=A0AAD4GVD8_ASPNN|nr:hypothetical protein FE257_007473 [Aspergillus nanangensis]